MELLKHINNNLKPVSEDATAGGATGAGGVAMMATPLFASLVKRIPVVEPEKKKKKTKKRGLGLQEAFDDSMDPTTSSAMPDQRSSSAPTFDAAGVVAKLKSLEKKDSQDYRDTVSFGLEDENGGLVRVTVKAEQAADFEKALQAHLAPDEDSETPEIAEILFDMRNQFDIVDVQWPNVEEDEEEDTQLSPGEMPPEGEMSPEGGMPPEGDLPPNDMLGGGAGEEQAASVLTQVIDMMKADADARKAEARAREAEAKAKEAESVVNQATAKVKQEEQFLDMDSYNKAKKDEDREAKRLAQLAKWKHDMDKENGVSDDEGSDNFMPSSHHAPEEEEYTMRRPAPVAKQQPRKTVTATRVRPQEVADFILNRVKK